MNINDLLHGQKHDQIVAELAKNFGVNENQIDSILQQLLPILSRGLRVQAQNPNQQQQLLHALDDQHHQQYIDDPQTLTNKETREDGKKILGHLFDNDKDFSRQVSQHAANQAGVQSALVKKILPIVAAAAMGAISKQVFSNGQQQTGQDSDGFGQMLTSFLDADNDGSIADDLMDLAQRFFGGGSTRH